MTISKELFLAILSMDSYNRGYGAGISDGDANDPDGLGGLQSQIGNATVINQNISPEAQAAGFYAIAYEWNGETIISYRGTDNFPGEIFLTDIPIFRGDYDEAQIHLASQFYNSVASAPGANSEITLTGHSLGGALAGFVAALHGEDAARKNLIPIADPLLNALIRRSSQRLVCKPAYQ